MSGLDREPGLDADDEIELAGLIETLRGATPSREALASVRAEVVRAEGKRAQRPASRSTTAWQLAAVLAIAFALGVLARDAMLGSSGPLAAGPEQLEAIEPAPAVSVAEAPALVPAAPIEVIVDDAPTASPVARFVETAGSFPSIDEGDPDAEEPGDEVLDCRDPTAP